MIGIVSLIGFKSSVSAVSPLSDSAVMGVVSTTISSSTTRGESDVDSSNEEAV